MGLALQRQRLERGDTGGTGQPLQPERLLVLRNNALSGEIPAELGSLSNLVWLDLSVQRVELGRYRRSWAASPTCIDLRLGSNELSGEIPPELGSLSNLRDAAPLQQPS